METYDMNQMCMMTHRKMHPPKKWWLSLYNEIQELRPAPSCHIFDHDISGDAADKNGNLLTKTPQCCMLLLLKKKKKLSLDVANIGW